MYYKKSSLSNWILAIQFFFCCFITHSQETTISANTQFPINITFNASEYKDLFVTNSIKQLIPEKFKPLHKNYFVFPFSNQSYWLRIQIRNTNSSVKKWVLLWDNPLVEQLDFYISDSNRSNFKHTPYVLLTKNKLKKLYSEAPHFNFELLPHTSKTIYIKLTSKRANYGSLSLFPNEAFTTFRYDNFALQGMLNGFVIFRLLLVFLLGVFVIKEAVFRAYSIQIVIKTVAFWGILNNLGPLFCDNPTTAAIINNVSIYSTVVGSCIFALWAFEICKIIKWIKCILFVFIASAVIINLALCISYQWYWLMAGAFLIVVCNTFLVGLFFYSILKKIKTNIYYSIPFLLGIITFLLINFRLLTEINIGPVNVIAYLLFVFEFLTFVLFLGRIIRLIEIKKISAEENLRTNQEQNKFLKELDELKTRFFTNISHEFRTPLTLLVGPIDDLQKKYPNEGILKIMQRNLNRLQNLINQILEISKLEAGEMTINKEEADIVRFLIQIVASFESLAQDKDIIFNHSVSQKAIFGNFDLDKIEKIMTNLLSNALKFTPRNGRVMVKISFDDEQTENNKKGLKSKSLLQISVEDFGIGIAPERLPYIFDRFYQVDDSNQRLHEGSGIGLALVKELMDVLEGTIEVKSVLNQGTTFVLTLPYEPLVLLSQNAKMPILKFKPEVFFDEKNSNADDLEKNENDQIMLIVEDNPDLRMYMSSIFENQYQLITAVDGEEGLAKAIEFVPDIVISDLMMPKLDGLGFCAKLKKDERISHIPVIMLTAKARIEDKLIGLQQGADDYLSKPFNKEELSLRVSNLIQQRQLLREKYATQTIAIKPEKVVVTESTLEDLFIEKAQAVIDNYLDKSEFDAATFALEMKLSPVQLRRKLKAITNQTSTEFVRNYRLEAAAEMLKKGEKTVSQVAYKVGFESLPYFSKVFQDKFGKTASEWK
ncbi:hypothetical protein AR687_24485 [Flavobacteriaceae bacterium CRH]|nr:hypothetical protein AR687_24485 [Flavobacteriaceae bacterium CRH]